jgi:hypothetical protein
MWLVLAHRLFLSSRAALIAENLFLRKQLALFQERLVKPRRSTAATRASWSCSPGSLIGVKLWSLSSLRHFLDGMAPRSGRSGDGSLESEADRNCQRTCAN